ncbi:unnamed protein product [Rhodiola kirilowii]
MWRKVNDWRCKLLSAGGREVLIKAVLQAMPVYMMSVYHAPSLENDEVPRSSHVTGFGSKTLLDGVWWDERGATFIWKHISSGLFSVRSAYDVMNRNDELSKSGFGEQSDKSTVVCFGKRIWSARVPNKIKVFCWRLYHNSLPDCRNLMRRGIALDSHCKICGSPDESSLHVVKDCWWAKLLYVQFGLPIPLLNGAASGSSKPADLVWHEKDSWSIERAVIIGKNILNLLEHSHWSVPLPNANVNESWIPPAKGKIKINVDRSWEASSREAGLGIVARDHLGSMQWCWAREWCDSWLLPVIELIRSNPDWQIQFSNREVNGVADWLASKARSQCWIWDSFDAVPSIGAANRATAAMRTYSRLVNIKKSFRHMSGAVEEKVAADQQKDKKECGLEMETRRMNVHSILKDMLDCNMASDLSASTKKAAASAKEAAAAAKEATTATLDLLAAAKNRVECSSSKEILIGGITAESRGGACRQLMKSRSILNELSFSSSMPLLDISVGQPLQDYANVMKVQGLTNGAGFSNLSFSSGKSLGCTWKNFGIPSRRCEIEFVDMRRGELIIKAIATLESRSSVPSQKGCKGLGFEVNRVQFSSEDSEELDEPEKLRRMRISKANKGNLPWNKGRKHSAETLRRIKERTRLAMQDPKVKMKLANQGHAQSEETKAKIAVGVRMGWERRRQRMQLQEICHFEWQNLIAEASRRGFLGEEELQWDSYKSVLNKEKTPKVVGSRRAPKSAEQRRKIAEAISAKWSDPDYRNRVCSAQAKFYGKSGVERKSSRLIRDPTQIRSRSAAEKTSKDVQSLSSEGVFKIVSAQAKLKRSNAPKYKDPMASSNLEIIKNIKAQRAASDTKKTEAIARARLMIGEAEKAAEALEAAASTNPHSMASLIETRKLIKEAIQSIQSIDSTTSVNALVSTQSSENSDELGSIVLRQMHIVNRVNGADVKINGTRPRAISNHEDSHFSDLTPHVSTNDEEEVLPVISNGHASAAQQFTSSSNLHLNKQVQQPVSIQTIHSRNTESTNEALTRASEQKAPSNLIANKRWVRGRLVEIEE